MKCGVPKNAARSQVIDAVKKTSLKDLQNMGMLKKYNPDIVKQIYEYLTA
jgi:ABC-type Fe3+ transport system substrate-binding protein